MIQWKKLSLIMASAALAVTGLTVGALAISGLVNSQNAEASDVVMVTDDDLSDTYVIGPETWGVTPNDEQLYYMKSGLAAFCHFGPNTFNNVEWGDSYGTASPSEIFPMTEKFDAEGLVLAVKEAGFSRIMLTAKHHDGFCLWDSDYTDYDIGSTDYDGDILEEISDACTKYNLDMGLYLSPWDIHEDKYGCFGDSNNTENYAGYTDYNELYIAWITEICTATKEDGSYKYGNNNPDRRSDRFVEWWMDGAQGSGSHIQTYDWTGILNAIHETNPNCQVFGTHAAINGINEGDAELASTGGIHWIGNENGVAADETWAKVLKGFSYEDTSLFPRVDSAIVGKADGDQWSVPEADVKMLSGWFWRESAGDETVKTESELADIYFRTVGHGATLLLNLSPNQSGSVGEDQMSQFQQLAANIEETFDEDFTRSEGATASATSVWGNSTEYSPSNVIDDIPEGEEYDETYWAPAEGESTGTLEITLGGLRTFDVVSIEEYIQKGQAISSWSVEYKDITGEWHEFDSGATISSKRLCRSTPVEGTAIRINILSTYDDTTPMICNVGVYKASEGFELESGDTAALPSNLESISVSEFTLDDSWTFEDDEQTSAWSNASNGAEASFTFTGTKVWIIGTKDPGHGTADVYIDGEFIETIDTEDTDRNLYALIYESPELEYGTHTVRLVCATDALGLSEARYTDGSGVFEMNPTETSLYYGETTEIEIVRTLGSQGEVTVQYSTQSSGAEQGVNYENLSGTVTFADGETSKTITLTGLENDRSTDGKDFYFTLIDTGDASIGANSYTHVTLYNREQETETQEPSSDQTEQTEQTTPTEQTDQGSQTTDQTAQTDQTSQADQSSQTTQTVQTAEAYDVGSCSYGIVSDTDLTVKVIGTASGATKVVVPGTVNLGGKTYKVISIADSAFKNNKKITSVTIGKNVQSIGKNAFAGCTKLKTVTVKGNSLKQIGSKAFSNCKKLKTITIKSKSLKKVGKSAFKGIYKKAVIKVPSAKLKSYRKLLANKGQSKTVTIKSGK